MTAETVITAALYTLPTADLSRLTHSISSVLQRHLLRLSAVLSSPILFSLALRHLHSLSLHQKSLLISRHLLSKLTLLTHIIIKESPPLLHPAASACMSLRDLDAVLLLLLLCELQHHDKGSLDAPPPQWCGILREFLCSTVLRLSSFGGWSGGEVLIQYVENVGRCWNLVRVMGGKEWLRETAASPTAVVSLPSVDVARDMVMECVICKEEMKEGREVCKLPCGHCFHWICIITWLKKRSTCPCCRHRLPTEDVRHEIERLMEEMTKIAHHHQSSLRFG